MPSTEYETRTDSVLAWKKAQKLGRFDPNAPSIEQQKILASEREVEERGKLIPCLLTMCLSTRTSRTLDASKSNVQPIARSGDLYVCPLHFRELQRQHFGWYPIRTAAYLLVFVIHHAPSNTPRLLLSIRCSRTWTKVWISAWAEQFSVPSVDTPPIAVVSSRLWLLAYIVE
jgi:hypothetical protein